VTLQGRAACTVACAALLTTAAPALAGNQPTVSVVVRDVAQGDGFLTSFNCVAKANQALAIEIFLECGIAGTRIGPKVQNAFGTLVTTHELLQRPSQDYSICIRAQSVDIHGVVSDPAIECWSLDTYS
jgi:hypothetical protein